MTAHSVINANGKTHAKIAALAGVFSAVFVALVSASSIGSGPVATRTAGPVIKASTTMHVVTSDRIVVR